MGKRWSSWTRSGRHLALVLVSCVALPAAALPEGITTADIALWYGGPSYNRSVTGRSFVIVPSQAGAGAIGENGALARVQFVGPTGGSGPGLGLVPGQPGAVLVELGIQATLTQLGKRNLTESGEPGADVLAPMWRDIASASALYRDQLTFSDASLPAGAPLTVSLSYYLSTNKCDGGPGDCVLLPPPSFNANAATFAYSLAVVEVASSVTLPSGVDRKASVRTDSYAGLGGGLEQIGLRGNTLTHTFTVANGATHDYALSLIGSVVYDGLSYLAPDGRASVGGVQSYFDLDYLDTLHIGAIEATDSQGRALPGFGITNSLGWTLATTPPVPEPATWGLMLMGLGTLGWVLRRRRRQLLIALVCAAGAAQAQTPSLQIQGRADSSMAVGTGTPAEFNHVRQGRGNLSDSVLSLGSLTDPAVDIALWSRSGAQALASAQLGHLGVLAGGEVVLGALGGGGQYAHAHAQASFTDWLTLNPADPALMFTPGTLRFRVDYSGNGGVVDLSTTARVLARWCGRAGAADFSCGGWFSDTGETGVGRQSGPLPGAVEYEQRFVWGLPVAIGVTLTASFDLELLNNGSANGYFDLSHSATWGGILSVRTSAGELVAPQDYALSSASGTDYGSAITPVPEPAAMLLWLLGAVMLLARRRLPWALALFGTAVQAQQVGVSGRLNVGLSGEGFNPIEYSQGSSAHPLSDGVQAQRNLQDPSVLIDDWAVAGGQSRAHAGFGWLGVQVGATVDVGTLASSGGIHASARAQFSDLLTITPADPALLGTWGRFSYTVAVSGNGGIDDASTNGYGTVAYGGLGLPSGGWISSAQGLGRGEPTGSPLPVVVTFESFTRFGLPTFIELRLDAELQVLVFQGRVDAFADLMHTASWGGIASVSTLDGRLLAPDRYTLASASGTDYRGAISAVPELPPAWLLALGLCALRWRWRAGRSDP